MKLMQWLLPMVQESSGWEILDLVASVFLLVNLISTLLLVDSILGGIIPIFYQPIHTAVARRVLPAVIDVGTNNPKLKEDPRYLGDREDRLEGDEYYELIDEFMAAIKLRWPRALIQFEDFQSKHAVHLLARYAVLWPTPCRAILADTRQST